jgi:hypothetical protein
LNDKLGEKDIGDHFVVKQTIEPGNDFISQGDLALYTGDLSKMLGGKNHQYGVSNLGKPLLNYIRIARLSQFKIHGHSQIAAALFIGEIDNERFQGKKRPRGSSLTLLPWAFRADILFHIIKNPAARPMVRNTKTATSRDTNLFDIFLYALR